MRIFPSLFVMIPVFALAFTEANDANACGGCFVQQSENTQVTGHRMILSVSKTQTTLWDQIVYTGEPASFAWVLPIKGQVNIELSSDALFETLDQLTQVQILSPQIICPQPPFCEGDNFGASGNVATSGAGGGSDGGVTVIAQEVVGPYETVQLAANDPTALQNWLSMNGYNVPADVKPVVDAYQAEGFAFLALKLVPGQGIDSMRPVRVTTPGATPVLPLRMVAAGTGAITPISLWLFSEGRYEPTNFPSFTLKQDDMVWDWDSSSSNYKALRQAEFDKSDGKAWHVESAEPFSIWQLDQLRWLAESQPKESGYADDMGNGAVEACDADLAALMEGIEESTLWLQKLHAELPRSALATDLEVGASMDQSVLPHILQLTKTTGTEPSCPTFPPCSDSSGGSNNPWDGFWGSNNNDAAGGGCAVTGTTGIPAALGMLGLSAALAFARRRRRSS
jgi:hypothetical protein